MAEVKVNKVCKTLGKIVTLDNLTLEVKHNEFVVLVGPSGCGKSTLLNIISGLIMPDSGTIELGGKNCTGQTGRVSYMQQKDLLLYSRNILDNITIPLILKGMNKKQARKTARAYLPDFGLDGFASYYPRQLSGGMRQRAALLRTYLFTRDILLLDEPFASLDAISRHRMHLWLIDLQKRYKSSILFVTHDIEEGLMLADRIYVLSARPAKVLEEINLHNLSLDVQVRENIKKSILNILEKEAGDSDF